VGGGLVGVEGAEEEELGGEGGGLGAGGFLLEEGADVFFEGLAGEEGGGEGLGGAGFVGGVLDEVTRSFEELGGGGGIAHRRLRKLEASSLVAATRSWSEPTLRPWAPSFAARKVLAAQGPYLVLRWVKTVSVRVASSKRAR